MALRHPLAAISVILAAQTVTAIWTKELWVDEVRHGNVLQHLIRDGHWLLLYANGEAYLDKPPVYFWLLAIPAKLFGTDGPPIFLAGVALSSLLFLFITYLLARRVASGDVTVALLSALLLLTNFHFIDRSHVPRMDLFFAALIVLSHVCFFAAWERRSSWPWCVAGFGTAAIACLTKGPLGLAFPVLASLAFLAWQGRLKRIWNWDVLSGVVFAAVILGAWFLGLGLAAEPDVTGRIFREQIFLRAVDTHVHAEPFYYYALMLPVHGLPWTLILVGLPMALLWRKKFWSGLWKGRGSAAEGSVYLWSVVVTGFLLLSALSGKNAFYLLPIFPALAVLAARELARLPSRRVNRVVIAVGALLIVQALGIPWLRSAYGFEQPIGGLIPAALVFGVIGIVLIKNRRNGLGPSMALLTLGVTAAVQFYNLMTIPSVNPVMSPRAQGELMARYIGEGYTPISFRSKRTLYAYYAGHAVREIEAADELEKVLAAEPRVVLGMPKKEWENLESRPRAMEKIDERAIEYTKYVLLVQPAGEAD